LAVAPVPEPLLLVGAGGFGRETAEVVGAVNEVHRDRYGAARWDLRGFLDDDAARWGSTVSGTSVVGPVAVLADDIDARAVVCAGNPRDRTAKARIVDRLARLGITDDRYATVVHPRASLARSCVLGVGTVALAGVVATCDVTVGAHVGLMPQVVLTHDDHLADFVIAGSGARLAGGVTVDTGAYLGAGCLVREGLRIGRWALLAMGAALTHDVPPAEVWAGVPAHFLRTVDLPPEVLSA
jgi:sugar O-acyltransferase (sialic acid O-acetyltransferase NeuD family)